MTVSHRRLDRNISFAICFACLGVYLLFWSGHHYSIDGVVMFQYAKALLFQHSFEMSPPVRWGQNEFVVGQWSIGLSLAYIPGLALLAATLLRGDPDVRNIPFHPTHRRYPELLNNTPYQLSSWLNPLLTALTAVSVYWLARRLGLSRSKAALSALIFGLASPAAAYARFDYAQPLTALLLLLAVLCLLRSQALHLRWLALSGLFLGLVGLTRTELLLPAGAALGLALLFTGAKLASRPMWPDFARRMLAFGLPLLLLVLLNQFFNYQRFGSWLAVGYQPERDFQLSLSGFFTALLGNLVSPGRGVLFFFPFSLFAGPGLIRLRRSQPSTAWMLAVLLLGTLLLYSLWGDWAAGLSWGPRFLIPLLPYLCVLSVIGLDTLWKWAPPCFPNAGRLLLVLGAGLVGLGALAALQGLFYNYLVYYGRLDVPPELLDGGRFHFYPQYSPLIVGWAWSGAPTFADVYWLKHRAYAPHILSGVSLLLLSAGLLGWHVRKQIVSSHIQPSPRQP